LQQSAKDGLGKIKGMMVPDQQLDSARRCPHPDDFDRLRMTQFGNEKSAGAVPANSVAPCSSLQPRRCLHPEVRNSPSQTGQARDHSLEIQQRLEPALRDLR